MIWIIVILGAGHLLWVVMAWREHRRLNPKPQRVHPPVAPASVRRASGRIAKRLKARLRRRAAALPGHW
jgi:hypothetical protein